MASDAGGLRCPSCGSPLGPLPPPAATLRWVRCRHCGVSVPLAPHGLLPPRFTWEVYPGLYPSQPPLSGPRFRWRGLIVPVLLAIVVVSAGVAAGAAYYGWAGSQPAQYTVSGTVILSNGAPASGGSVTFTDQAGTLPPVSIGTQGTFSVSGVPTGGVELNVTYPHYAPLLVVTFVCPAYDAGTQGLALSLNPGTVSNESVLVLSPYPSFHSGYSPLEYFQADVGAAAAIAAIAAILSAVGAVILRRSDRPAIGIVGGAAGAAVPFALLVLPVGTVFPLLLLVGLVLGILGAFAFAVAWIEIIQVGDRSTPPPQARA